MNRELDQGYHRMFDNVTTTYCLNVKLQEDGTYEIFRRKEEVLESGKLNALGYIAIEICLLVSTIVAGLGWCWFSERRDRRQLAAEREAATELEL